MITYFLKAVILLALCISASAEQLDEHQIVSVSLISLIANPTKFDGKLVDVEGIGYFDSKNSINAVFLTRDDKLAGNGQNGLFLFLSPTIGNIDRFNNKYVVVRGQFRSGTKGHLGAFSGSLTDVDRVQPIPLIVK